MAKWPPSKLAPKKWCVLLLYSYSTYSILIRKSSFNLWGCMQYTIVEIFIRLTSPRPPTRCITSQTRALWQWRWRRVCLASISFSGHIRPPSSPKSQHPSLLPNHAQHSIQCQCQVPPMDPSEATYLLAVSLSHETQLEIRLGT